MSVELDSTDATDCRFDCVPATQVDSNAEMLLEAEIVPKKSKQKLFAKLLSCETRVSSLHRSALSGKRLAGIVFATVAVL